MATTLPKYVGIVDQTHKNLVRDTFSMGIQNWDARGLAAAQRKKNEAMLKLAEQRRKDMELNTLRKEVTELKELIFQLLEKKEQ